jgi:hypothetical protein
MRLLGCVQTHAHEVIHVTKVEDKKHSAKDGLSVSGASLMLTCAAPALISAIEDVGRRLQKQYVAPSESKEIDVAESKHEEAPPVPAPAPAAAAGAGHLALVGEDEAKLREAVAKGNVKGLAKGMKVRRRDYVAVSCVYVVHARVRSSPRWCVWRVCVCMRVWVGACRFPTSTTSSQ